ncbi:RNA polymerase sigma-70 factor (ECF subfamily) [Alteromonadaceae bacterium 2753L.S.0a.02]|nr:RNA polymerase sigma-70 factor (ECF subfamily) [Alteromonadaceae bacterium 2753L.S.0a.02]
MPPDFEQLITANHARIRAIARRYADTGCEDDLYQEILEQLWRSFGQFQGKSAATTWVYRIGLNTAMTRLRKTIKQREAQQKLHSFTQAEVVHAERCHAEILQDFLKSLNDVDASVLMMYLDNLSGREIAAVLGVPVNSVEVRISRLKKAFAQRYVEV